MPSSPSDFERKALFPVLNIAALVTTVLALAMYLHRTLRAKEI